MAATCHTIGGLPPFLVGYHWQLSRKTTASAWCTLAANVVFSPIARFVTIDGEENTEVSEDGFCDDWCSRHLLRREPGHGPALDQGWQVGCLCYPWGTPSHTLGGSTDIRHRYGAAVGQDFVRGLGPLPSQLVTDLQPAASKARARRP